MAAVVGATEAGEAFAEEFDRLVSQAASIADLVDEIRNAALEFEQMVHTTLDELDSEVSSVVHQATGWTEDAQTALLDLSKGLDTMARDFRGEVVQLTRSTAADIGHAVDQQTKTMHDCGKLAMEAMGTLNSELQSLASDVRNRINQVDQLWVEAHGANQVVHQQAKQAAQEFTTRLSAVMENARTDGEALATELDQGVLVPIEQALAELDEQVRGLCARLFDEGLSSLSESVENTVRGQIGELVDQAIEAIKEMVKEKMNEILDRRYRSEPERKALEGIFDTLKNLLGPVEEKVGAVKEIRSIVGG